MVKFRPQIHKNLIRNISGRRLLLGRGLSYTLMVVLLTSVTAVHFGNLVSVDGSSDGQDNSEDNPSLPFWISKSIPRDMSGNEVRALMPGSTVVFDHLVVNPFHVKIPYVLLMQIKDESDVTIYQSWVADRSGSTGVSKQMPYDYSWVPTRPGKYTTEVFVWQSPWIRAIPLAPFKDYTIFVSSTDRGPDYEITRIEKGEFERKFKLVSGLPLWTLDTDTNLYVPLKVTFGEELKVDSGKICVKIKEGNVKMMEPGCIEHKESNPVSDNWTVKKNGEPLPKRHLATVVRCDGKIVHSDITFPIPPPVLPFKPSVIEDISTSMTLKEQGIDLPEIPLVPSIGRDSEVCTETANVQLMFNTGDGLQVAEYSFEPGRFLKSGLKFIHYKTLDPLFKFLPGTYTAERSWSMNADRIRLHGDTQSMELKTFQEFSKDEYGDRLRSFHFLDDKDRLVIYEDIGKYNASPLPRTAITYPPATLGLSPTFEVFKKLTVSKFGPSGGSFASAKFVYGDWMGSFSIDDPYEYIQPDPSEDGYSQTERQTQTCPSGAWKDPLLSTLYTILPASNNDDYCYAAYAEWNIPDKLRDRVQTEAELLEISVEFNVDYSTGHNCVFMPMFEIDPDERPSDMTEAELFDEIRNGTPYNRNANLDSCTQGERTVTLCNSNERAACGDLFDRLQALGPNESCPTDCWFAVGFMFDPPDREQDQYKRFDIAAEEGSATNPTLTVIYE